MKNQTKMYADGTKLLVSTREETNLPQDQYGRVAIQPALNVVNDRLYVYELKESHQYLYALLLFKVQQYFGVYDEEKAQYLLERVVQENNHDRFAIGCNVTEDLLQRSGITMSLTEFMSLSYNQQVNCYCHSLNEMGLEPIEIKYDNDEVTGSLFWTLPHHWPTLFTDSVHTPAQPHADQLLNFI